MNLIGQDESWLTNGCGWIHEVGGRCGMWADPLSITPAHSITPALDMGKE